MKPWTKTVSYWVILILYCTAMAAIGAIFGSKIKNNYFATSLSSFLLKSYYCYYDGNWAMINIDHHRRKTNENDESNKSTKKKCNLLFDTKTPRVISIDGSQIYDPNCSLERIVARAYYAQLQKQKEQEQKELAATSSTSSFDLKKKESSSFMSTFCFLLSITVYLWYFSPLVSILFKE